MKKILTTLLFGVIILNLTGCNGSGEVTLEDLESVNSQIASYFEENGIDSYDNYSFSYIDEENDVVVVGLLDNSLEEQEKFKELITDSELIKFVYGENFSDESSDADVTLESFVRTYEILNIANSNDENYVWITIRQFQAEEVFSLKIQKSLCPQIEEGKYYEFTIKPSKSLEDNLSSIFSNSTIISIEETDKVGLEQRQDSI